MPIFSKNRESAPEKTILRPWLILIAALCGIALILFGSSKESDEEPISQDYSLEKDEMVLYQSYLEERVRGLCRSVSGVGEVHAVVTLAGGFESVYATELSDGDEVYVIIGSGTGAKALFLSRNAPEIAGIGVVTSSPVSAECRRELTELLCASFGIPSNHIHITDGGI